MRARRTYRGPSWMKTIVLGENAEVLPTLPDAFARLVYIDPPFNTGKVQKRDRIRVTATEGAGERGGFGGRRYDVEKVESGSYDDDFDDFEAFLMPRIEAALRCLTARRVALRPPRLPRGPPHQGRPRPAPRSPQVHQRDHLGLRLRRTAQEPLAGEARHDPLVRDEPRRLRLQLRRDGPHPVHGARASSDKRRRSAARRRPTCGGTPSCRPTGARRPATRRKSRWAS